MIIYVINAQHKQEENFMNETVEISSHIFQGDVIVKIILS